MRYKQILESYDLKLPDYAKNAHLKLASDQRGEPENFMVKLQFLIGGGVMNSAIEHVGDLTNRVGQVAKLPGWGVEAVSEKCEKSIRWLSSGYGFEREFEENITNNYLALSEDKKFLDKFPDEDSYRKQIYNGLDKYANLHAKLVVYNEHQERARDAAYFLGKRDFDTTLTALRLLQKVVDGQEPAINLTCWYEKLDDPGEVVAFIFPNLTTRKISSRENIVKKYANR